MRDGWGRRGVVTAAWFALCCSLAQAATHYPVASLCYDCHAVSKSKMVVNTHLIKLSQKALDLGVTGGAPVPCLFCHEPNASAAPFDAARQRPGGGYKMAPVMDHFDAFSASKHPVPLGSSTVDTNALDCIDCHANLGDTVTPDGAGNASIHAVDAATQNLDPYPTLIGAPADAAQVSANTCQAADCHDGDGGLPTEYDAPKAHSMGNTTINDVTAVTSCTQCHGSHNSYRAGSLIILKTDGSTSKLATEPVATLVTPEKCGECHTQDDGTAYDLQGHGKAGIALDCTTCHDKTVAHAFNELVYGAATPPNPLRYALTVNTTAQSVIRQQAAYNQVYSICLTCHSSYGPPAAGAGSHQGHDGLYAGCNDCHEPHGAVGANIMMVRDEIPKVDAAGTPVYGESSPTGTWETVTYTATTDAYRADGTGLCDSAECHQGQLAKDNTTALYPLGSLMSGSRHSEGDQSPGAACMSCHTHADSAGSWGAANACLLCHGQPPPAAAAGYAGPAESTTGHQKHAGIDAGEYNYDCSRCHAAYPTGHKDGTYQSVAFGGLNPTGTYNGGSYTCNSLYCHSDGQTAASAAASPAWNAGALGCNSCHGTGTTANTLTFGAPDHPNGGVDTANSHDRHATYACAVCHSATISDAVPADGWTLASTTLHANGTKNLLADGTTATFTTGGATTCGTVSCHGGGDADWGATLSCADCHLGTADVNDYTFGNAVAASVKGAGEWDTTGHGRPSGNYRSNNPAGSLPDCTTHCHTSSVAHNDPNNPFRLITKGGSPITDFSDAADPQADNTVCLDCHSATGQASGSASLHVEENHFGAKHTGSETAGGSFCWDCHDPHGDTQDYMVHSGDGSTPGAGVTDLSDGTYGIPASSRPVAGLDVSAGGYTSADLVQNATGSGGTYNGLCQTCHAAGGGGAGYFYRNAAPPASGGHNGYASLRCTVCHSHQKDFEAGCTDCHGVDRTFSPTAPQVVNEEDGGGVFGSHLKALKTDALNRQSNGFDWTAQCNQCHTGHGGTVTVPLPPTSWSDPSGRMTGTNMQTQLGLGYTANGGIHLGGTATSATTEAELCWGCHANAANSVSEWGYNTRSTPSGFPVVYLPFTTADDGTAQTFNFGWIYQSNYTTKVTDWTAGYWKDQYDPLLRRRIASLHTGSFDPAGQSSSVAANVTASGVVNRTSPTLENRSYIRCSYCHDVHALNRAQNDTASGKPYLRGNWMGNPYPPEIPPRSTYTYTTAALTHGTYVIPKTPRGLTTARDKGGYFIDQNSGWPTRNAAMNTKEATAGLCLLCHATNVNTLDFYTGSTLWRAGTVNGHSNSTLGGTRANARNLFSANRGGYYMAIQNAVAFNNGACGEFGCSGPYPLSTLIWGATQVGPLMTNTGWYNWNAASIASGTNPYAGSMVVSARNNVTPTGDYTNWYVTAGAIGGASGPGTMAHEFTCSKCHSPHATGLPALLTQN
ncbi:MAG: CxxxxCH/CxxCH domain-containing protein, partial [Deferrisomatales bacterium]|nr:CxxxxCH/CxxCH domain-containing protein [Deferrisomatales bacterium]